MKTNNRNSPTRPPFYASERRIRRREIGCIALSIAAFFGAPAGSFVITRSTLPPEPAHYDAYKGTTLRKDILLAHPALKEVAT